MLLILYWFFMVYKLENLTDSVREKIKNKTKLVELGKNIIIILQRCGAHSQGSDTHAGVESDDYKEK